MGLWGIIWAYYGMAAGDRAALPGGPLSDPRPWGLRAVWVPEGAAHVPHGAARHGRPPALPWSASPSSPIEPYRTLSSPIEPYRTL